DHFQRLQAPKSL
ncbi:hypothetical protein ACTFIR_009752, partial [Dictyostelium discoideum]